MLLARGYNSGTGLVHAVYLQYVGVSYHAALRGWCAKYGSAHVMVSEWCVCVRLFSRSRVRFGHSRATIFFLRGEGSLRFYQVHDCEKSPRFWSMVDIVVVLAWVGWT